MARRRSTITRRRAMIPASGVGIFMPALSSHHLLG
jgi:hypothetical protein